MWVFKLESLDFKGFASSEIVGVSWVSSKESLNEWAPLTVVLNYSVIRSCSDGKGRKYDVSLVPACCVTEVFLPYS